MLPLVEKLFTILLQTDMSVRVALESVNSTEPEIETERKRSCFHRNIQCCRAQTSGHYCCRGGQFTHSHTRRLTYTHIITRSLTPPLLVCVPGSNLQPHVQLLLPGSHFTITPMAPSRDRTVSAAFFHSSSPPPLPPSVNMTEPSFSTGTRALKSTADPHSFKHNPGMFFCFMFAGSLHMIYHLVERTDISRPILST